MAEFGKSVMDVCVAAGSKIILAVLVWFVGKWFITRLMQLVSKLKSVEKIDPTVTAFALNAARGALYVLLVVSIIGIMGVPMASIVAVIASSGVAIGLALQGALSNLAGGIMLLVFRPFSVGDYVSAAGAEGLGFAIPSVTVKSIVDQLISQGYVSGRPLLGLSGESLSPFYQHYYLLPAGLYITAVETGSPADLAGILPRDILLTLDGIPVSSQDDLDRLLMDRQVGDSVTLTLYRAGQQGRVELTLTEDMG